MTRSTNEVRDYKAFEGLIWKRALDFAEYPHLFGPAITTSDVQQGKLGNCGFAASLTAISVHPQLIHNLFVFPPSGGDANGINGTISDVGLYELKLCHNGIWNNYTIDDLIPCSYHGQPAFCSHEKYVEVYFNPIPQSFVVTNCLFIALLHHFLVAIFCGFH